MLLKLKPGLFLGLEHITRIDITDTGVLEIMMADGEQYRFADPEVVERFSFFINEVFIGNVVDLDQIWDKKDKVLAAKKMMTDKLKAMEAQAQAEPDAGTPPILFNPQLRQGAPAVLRDSAGNPIKNVLVMPPRNRGGNGGNNGPATA